MLHELIEANRNAILEKSASLAPIPEDKARPRLEATVRAASFLDQLTEVLRVEHGKAGSTGSLIESEHRPAAAVQLSEAAAKHGTELRDLNFSIEEVVRNYGNLCQAITTFAMELDVDVEAAEFRTLNWCLDEGIAQAVVAYTTPPPEDAHRIDAARKKHDARLDSLAMMDYYVERVATAVEAMRTGRVGLDGATGAVLDKSLNHLRALIAVDVDQRF